MMTLLAGPRGAHGFNPLDAAMGGLPADNRAIIPLSEKEEPAFKPTARKTEKGDSFTPMATPTDKSMFPVASTLIGGGIGFAIGGSNSLVHLPKNDLKELKIKEGKGVTLDGEKVKHNGYTYQMEQVDGKYKLEHIIGDVNIGDEVWEHIETDKRKVLSQRITIGADSNQKAKAAMESILQLKEDEPLRVLADKNSIQAQSAKETIAFNVVKDADGKPILKESDHLLGLINDKAKPHITPAHVEELKKVLINDVKAMDAFDKFKTLKNPEAIENLIHGAGMQWKLIGAITAGAMALGAVIGYVAGNKKPQSPQ